MARHAGTQSERRHRTATNAGEETGPPGETAGTTASAGDDVDTNSTPVTATRDRILVTIQHPAHVHFFRPIVAELQARGHEVRVCARDKDVAVDLLAAHGLDHEVLAGSATSTLGRAAVQALYEGRLLRIARQFDPDVITAIGGVAAAHVATLTGARSVVMNDSEPAALTNKLAFPFADVVATPQWYDGDVGSGHVRYDGFHELAYLDPTRFTPDPERLRSHGVDPQGRYAVVRLVSWGAQHDVGESGFSEDGVRALASTLDDRGAVYVSAEGDVPDVDGIEPIPVPPADLHHLLSFADCYVGDSQTMATEAGLLGTPSVRYNSFVGDDDMANFRELAAAGLVFSTDDEAEAIDRAADYVADDGASDEWAKRVAAYRAEKTDVTAFMTDLLEEAAA